MMQVTENPISQKVKEGKLSIPVMISTLWIFVSLNYIFCDVLSNMDKETLSGCLAGNLSGVVITQAFLLIAGISLEIPFIMVVLSRILPYKANRILNMAFAVLMIVYQLGSFMVGSDNTLHYVFFSIIEIGGEVVIFILALRWKKAMTP